MDEHDTQPPAPFDLDREEARLNSISDARVMRVADAINSALRELPQTLHAPSFNDPELHTVVLAELLATRVMCAQQPLSMACRVRLHMALAGVFGSGVQVPSPEMIEATTQLPDLVRAKLEAEAQYHANEDDEDDPDGPEAA
jgi:hypothetical protein